MRFTLRLLGTEIFHISTDPESAEDVSLSGGVTTSYPIQVTHRYGMEPEPWSDYEE